MKTLHFVKMVAAGNDFLVLDGRADPSLTRLGSELARQLCPRRFAVGADGLLILDPPEREGCLFAMRYFNADGSRGAMCGNGARALALYAREEWGLFDREARFTTDAGECGALMEPDGRVRLSMPPGRVLAASLRAEGLAGRAWEGAWIDSGVPHFVAWIEQAEALERVDIQNEGAFLRRHPAFGAAGANVNFAAPRDDGGEASPCCAVRTYERGVEAETLGCGSGAVAVAAARLLALGQREGRVRVATRSGETLEIDLKLRDKRLEEVYLTGSAQRTFQGWVKADAENTEQPLRSPQQAVSGK
jgi:diaminopimelate epimerase